MGLLIGIALFVAGVIAFWMALPRDGKVASFLSNPTTQAYYVVAILAAMSVGLLNIVLGLVSVLS